MSDAEPPGMTVFGRVMASIPHGPGVVGLTYWALIAVVAAGAVAIGSMDSDLLRVIVFMVLLAFAGAVMWFSSRFAERNPQLAVMQSDHLLQWNLAQMNASDPKIIDQSPVGPNNPPAQLVQTDDAPRLANERGEDE